MANADIKTFDPRPAFEKIGIDGFKMILNAMQECVWVGDENERTIYANPKFCQLLGYTLEEIIGEESYIFWDEESARTVQKNNELRKHGDASQYEGILKSKTGELVPVFLSGTPIPSGGTVGIITDLREINTLKRVEEELTKLNSLKDDFIALVSHELRTPMTAIKGYLSMALEGDFGELSTPIRKIIQASYDSSLRLIDLINDMLSLSKIEKGQMTFNMRDIRVSDLVEEVKSGMEIVAKEKEVEFKFSAEPGTMESMVNVDVDRTKQVLFNFLTNAYKFTHEGGSVSLLLRKEPNGVRFAVADTGVGIPQEKIAKIFDKFYQVQNQMRHSEEGLGLGLALCHGIVTAHHSKIDVTSEVGKGSEFSFVLETLKS